MRSMAGLLLVGLIACSDRAEQPGRDPLVVSSPAATPSAAPAASPAPVAIAPPATPAPPVARLVMDVMQVVGESESGVSALLGPPTSCEDIHRARLCRYPPDGNEVMFVAGKADMITVQGMAAVPFDEQALVALGLAPASPDHSDADGIRWESLPGLEEVTIFPGQGNAVHYAYVKVGKH